MASLQEKDLYSRMFARILEEMVAAHAGLRTPCHDLETAAGSLVVVEQLSSFFVRLVGDCGTSGPSPHVPRAGSVPCLCDILFLKKFDGEYC